MRPYVVVFLRYPYLGWPQSTVTFATLLGRS